MFKLQMNGVVLFSVTVTLNAVQQSCYTLHFFPKGNFHQSRVAPPSTVHNITEDITVTSVVESVVPVSQSRMESADNQSDPSEDILIPTAPPQPVLLEDPLILNSPRISIPKKSEAVLKRNNWPGPTEFPNVSGN